MLLILAHFEVRHDIVPGPPRIPKTGPLVVILRMATEVDHAIDRTGAAECSPSWPVNLSISQVFFWLGEISPVRWTWPDDTGRAGRNLHPDALVFGASLQKQNRYGRIF